MAKLTIVANIKANPDKIDLVKAELVKLIDITRAEEGCINYDLHQDNENPAHFLFYEKLWMGAAYRHEDALSIIAQFEMKGGFSAGYAFDYTLSEIQDHVGGTHEIMIGYRFGDPLMGIRSPRYF